MVECDLGGDVALCFKPLNQQSPERKVDFLKGYIYSDYGGSKNLIIFHEENSSDLDIKFLSEFTLKLKKKVKTGCIYRYFFF